MRTHSFFAAAVLTLLGACSTPGVAVQAGYAQLTLDGDLGYAQAGNGIAVSQDLESGFGLGDAQGAPYARAMLDLGTPVLAVSGFLFDEEGDGQITAQFGDLTENTAVHKKFEMMNLKGSLAFDIPIGPVSLSPGIAVDYFDLDIQVRDAFGAVTEDVEVAGPVPMLFLRGQVDLGTVGLVAEAGYMKVDVEDVNASLLDIEALVEVRPIVLLNLFAGYRLMNLQMDGEVDGDAFDADITLRGFVIGGGIRF